jgi:hypothetical protein
MHRIQVANNTSGPGCPKTMVEKVIDGEESQTTIEASWDLFLKRQKPNALINADHDRSFIASTQAAMVAGHSHDRSGSSEFSPGSQSMGDVRG